MFEHATLQEAYTGALIAGKGKGLNNINTIMDRAKLPTADWARVRFGAGTPWRRCWCVITPPDEKEMQKLQKQLNKKKSAYDHSKPVLLRGDIKFYDGKKTKKIQPIATINDAYSAFAIYPQSKPLIDASTLVKVEGSITIHSNPPSTTEGFVFVMPEVHPAVTGFEMMLRWLFPVFDTFGLYGRPGRLVADNADARSLMFAMPKHRRYGYLEILDISGLILESGSSLWKEGEWRKRLKELTKKRMTAIEASGRSDSRYSTRRSTRNSFGPSQSRGIRFDDGASVRSQPSISYSQGRADGQFDGNARPDSAAGGVFATPTRGYQQAHLRSVSETQGLDRYANQSPSQYDGAREVAPAPPPHNANMRYAKDSSATPERISSEDEHPSIIIPVHELQDLQAVSSPEPVAAPPAFSHAPGAMPAARPYHSPELRRANSRMSTTTLSQLAGAGGAPGYLANVNANSPRTSEDHRRQNVDQYTEDIGQRGVQSDANTNELSANEAGLQGLGTVDSRFSFENPTPPRVTNYDPHTNHSQLPPHFPLDAARNIPLDSQTFPISSQDQPSNNRRYEPPQVFASPDAGRQSQQTLPGHISQSSADSTGSTRPQAARAQRSHSVARKPLPSQTSNTSIPTSAETISSTGSLGHDAVDQTAFGRNQLNQKPLPNPGMQRNNSGYSSIYEDANSTGSPDYASTRRSIDTRESMERPRAGVMKTVGNVGMGDERQANQQPNSQIHIDFGPTLNYAALRSNSPGTSQNHGRGAAMNNYPADRAPRTSVRRPKSTEQSRSPQRKAITPENANHPVEGRAVPWQPGSVTHQAPQQAITAEQFVQQRAAVTPLYAHQRQQSANNLRANTPTPPPKGHSRNNSSADMLQRPHSRGASVALGPSGTGELSAREQEHLARTTGQPLVNLATSSNRHLAPAGLVGAIDAREKDKQQLKQGINSQAVQQAIAQRQQPGAYQQYPDQLSPDYRGPAPQQGQYQQQQQRPTTAPRNQSYGMHAAANAYAQGGGWSKPTPPVFPSPSEQPYQPPPQQYAPAGRNSGYFPPQQGRGSPGYHGHGQ